MGGSRAAVASLPPGHGELPGLVVERPAVGARSQHRPAERRSVRVVVHLRRDRRRHVAHACPRRSRGTARDRRLDPHDRPRARRTVRPGEGHANRHRHRHADVRLAARCHPRPDPGQRQDELRDADAHVLGIARAVQRRSGGTRLRERDRLHGGLAAQRPHRVDSTRRTAAPSPSWTTTDPREPRCAP